MERWVGQEWKRESGLRTSVQRDCVWFMLAGLSCPTRRWVPPAHPSILYEHSRNTAASHPHSIQSHPRRLADCIRPCFSSSRLWSSSIHLQAVTALCPWSARQPRSRRTGLPRQRQLDDSGSSPEIDLRTAWSRERTSLCCQLQWKKRDAWCAWNNREYFPINLRRLH